MSQTASAETTPAVPSVEAFLDDMLVMRQRRGTPEERANIKWWRERVALLAKQQPATEPLPPAPALARAA